MSMAQTEQMRMAILSAAVRVGSVCMGTLLAMLYSRHIVAH
jgi:hypothetical protein